MNKNIKYIILAFQLITSCKQSHKSFNYDSISNQYKHYDINDSFQIAIDTFSILENGFASINYIDYQPNSEPYFLLKVNDSINFDVYASKCNYSIHENINDFKYNFYMMAPPTKDGFRGLINYKISDSSRSLEYISIEFRNDKEYSSYSYVLEKNVSKNKIRIYGRQILKNEYDEISLEKFAKIIEKSIFFTN